VSNILIKKNYKIYFLKILLTFFFKKNFFFLNFFFKKLPCKGFKKFFSKKFTIQSQHHISFFINCFIIKFCEIFFKKRVLFFFKKPKHHNSNLDLFVGFFKKIKQPFSVRFDKKNCIFLIYYSMLLKDSSLFLTNIINIFENNRIKSQKKIFFFLKNLILRFSIFFKRLLIRGVFFDIRGKIGATGNSKKKRLFFKCRKHSLTNKRLRINFSNGVVRTTTGVLGVSTYIFF